MFESQTYIERRKVLIENYNTGLLLFLGNNESPINYPANANTLVPREDSVPTLLNAPAPFFMM